MIRNSVLLAGIASLALMSSACAQKVGSYSGTSVDGGFITFSVAKDGANFIFTTGDVNFMAQCNNPSRIASEGWGFLLNQEIVDGANPFHSGNDYYDIRGSMHFTGPNTIKGIITSVTAVFVPGSDPPKKAQFCKAPQQAFTLTFQTAPHLPPVAPGTSVHHEQ